jgi:cell division septation protein DedD
VRARMVAFALAALAVSVAATARGQDNPAIQEAVRLAASGRGDEARRLVNAELAKARVGDAAYVEALYWRARIAMTGDSAERDLRRVAIEYPTSPWADDALLQLAQLAMAAGNPASAYTLAKRLRSDYPESALRPQAALWAGRAAFDLANPRGACALLDTARTEGAADIEFTNRVAFYHARCSALPPGGAAAPTGVPPGADTTSPPAAPAAEPRQAPGPAADRGPRFAIQVAAVRTQAEAARVLRQLSSGGYEGHVAVGSDGLRRVRVGAYASDGEARAALPALRRLMGGRPFVVRER